LQVFVPTRHTCIWALLVPTGGSREISSVAISKSTLEVFSRLWQASILFTEIYSYKIVHIDLKHKPKTLLSRFKPRFSVSKSIQKLTFWIVDARYCQFSYSRQRYIFPRLQCRLVKKKLHTLHDIRQAFSRLSRLKTFPKRTRLCKLSTFWIVHFSDKCHCEGQTIQKVNFKSKIFEIFQKNWEVAIFSDENFSS